MKKHAKLLICVLSLALVVAFMPSMAFAEGKASDKVTVTVVAGNQNGYDAVGLEYTATGDLAEKTFPELASTEPEGVSLFDVLVAVHASKYGEDKVKDNFGIADGGGYTYITKKFGSEDPTMTYVNGTYQLSANPQIKNGDRVFLGTYIDKTGWTDVYSKMGKDEMTTTAGKKVSVAVTADYSGISYTPSSVTLKTVNVQNGSLKTLKSTYKDGKVEFSIDKAGTYLIAPTGEATYEGWNGENTTGALDGDIMWLTVKEPSVKKAAIKKATVKKGKKAVVTWKKLSGVKGYQIAYKKAGTKKWTTKLIKKNSAKYTIKKLKAGKKYNIKVRAYKQAGSEKYYGKWSKIKTTKKALK